MVDNSTIHELYILYIEYKKEKPLKNSIYKNQEENPQDKQLLCFNRIPASLMRAAYWGIGQDMIVYMQNWDTWMLSQNIESVFEAGNDIIEAAILANIKSIRAIGFWIIKRNLELNHKVCVFFFGEDDQSLKTHWAPLYEIIGYAFKK